MNLRIWRSIPLLAALLLLAAGGAYGQSSVGRGMPGAPRPGSLIVTSNVQGASVLINNALVGTTPFSRNYGPGTYTVTVQATGYNDYNTTVTVAGQTTVNAYLQPINFSFTVNSNVNGATVYINGQQMGQAPYTVALSPGSYQLRVAAPGYQDFSTQVTVSQNTSINAQLQAINFNLTVNTNVNGANIIINGQQMGQAPNTIALAPGRYQLRVVAPGYEDFSTQVLVNRNVSVSARLRPQFAVVHIRIPDQFLDINSDRGRGNRSRARQDIQVYVDNHPVNQDSFQLQPGNHTIRFESGSLMVSQSFFFASGHEYTVSPVLSINIQ